MGLRMTRRWLWLAWLLAALPGSQTALAEGVGSNSCEIMLAHVNVNVNVNVKACAYGERDPGASLRVYIGRRQFETPDDATRLDLYGVSVATLAGLGSQRRVIVSTARASALVSRAMVS
jgi:hypothetical protein